MRRYLTALSSILITSVVLFGLCLPLFFRQSTKALDPTLEWEWKDISEWDYYEMYALVYDANHGIVYAGGYAMGTATSGTGVWKYQNQTWINTGGIISKRQINSLAYDAKHDILYAGCYDTMVDTAYNNATSVWKYENGIWSDTGGPGSNCIVTALAYDEAENVLYAGGQAVGTVTVDNLDATGVWAYNNGTWVKTGGAISDSKIQTLACDAKNHVVYAGTWGKGVWKYYNGIWRDTGDPVRRTICAFACDPMSGILYAGGYNTDGSGNGVWKYQDGTWSSTDQSIPNTGNYAITSLVYDSNNGVLYAGGYYPDRDVGFGIGVCRYQNGTWSDTGGPGDKFTIESLAYDSSRSVLFAGGRYYPSAEPIGVWCANTNQYIPSSLYYFAEGTCRPGFDPYLCIQNPGDYNAQVTITYMLGNGQTVSQNVTVPAHSRSTVGVKNQLGEGDDLAHDFSARVNCTNQQQIIVERPMYFNYQGPTNYDWNGGSDVVGTTSPASCFYFAEGTCRPNFETYICIQNPGDSDALIDITYMLSTIGIQTQQVNVPAHSRLTVRVKDKLGEADDDAHDFSAKVECINGQEIIAERPIYFNFAGQWTGGHDVLGTTTSSYSWYFAEGYTGTGFQEYLCISNPSNITKTTADVTFMFSDGTTDTRSYDIGSSSRHTVDVNQEIGQGKEVSILVHGYHPLIVERSMYFNYLGDGTCNWIGGHAVMGVNAPDVIFYFAEGTCRPNFDPYICIQNPGDTTAEVTITYMKGDGTTQEQILNVGANSRYTVVVKDLLGEGDDTAHDFSAKVECTNGQQVIVERPVYFNYNGVWTGGHNVVGYVPSE